MPFICSLIVSWFFITIPRSVLWLTLGRGVPPSLYTLLNLTYPSTSILHLATESVSCQTSAHCSTESRQGWIVSTFLRLLIQE